MGSFESMSDLLQLSYPILCADFAGWVSVAHFMLPKEEFAFPTWLCNERNSCKEIYETKIQLQQIQTAKNKDVLY